MRHDQDISLSTPVGLFWTIAILLGAGIHPYSMSGHVGFLRHFPELSLPLFVLIGIMYGPSSGFFLGGTAALVSQLVFPPYSFGFAAFLAGGMIGAVGGWCVHPRSDTAYKALLFHGIGFILWTVQSDVITPTLVVVLWHGTGALATLITLYFSKQKYYYGTVAQQFLIYLTAGVSALMMGSSIITYLHQPSSVLGVLDLAFSYQHIIVRYLIVGPVLVGVLGVVISRVLAQYRINLGVVLKEMTVEDHNEMLRDKD